ncbi:MAG: class I SAM-dependent methyltransferase [Vicinamibacterales bacterium]
MQIGQFSAALHAALQVRERLVSSDALDVYRVMDGAGDGVPGIYLDRLGPAAILSIYEDARLSDPATTDVADVCLDRLRDVGVNAVYVKLFARDRSRLGGMAPEEARSATPRAGTPQPETLCVHEYASRFEIRPYDGFSTGLFLEHREHRRSLAEMRPQRALNLFAYTCAFAVPLVAAGAVVVNVDVSARYLEWGRRNLALNGAPVDAARFVRMDAREYLTVAARRGEPFDLIIIDPPTFAAADPRRKRPAWKAVSDYPELIRAAARVLMPGGVIFAASNNRELAERDVLKQLVGDARPRTPKWVQFPPWPDDVRERGRVAAVCVSPR